MSESLSESKLENLIRQAFANTTPPETLTTVDGIVDHPRLKRTLDQEYWQHYDIVVSTHAGKTWQELALERPYKDFSALSVLTTEAYRYFLPAYMLFFIKDKTESLSNLQGDIILSFINSTNQMPANSQEAFAARYKKYIMGFTQEQKKAIILFLRYISKRLGVPENVRPEKALANLAEAWGDV